MNLLTKDSEVYSSCDQKQDPLILWTLLQTCHSQVGRNVSDEELRLKKMKLENLKQWDEKGNVCSLEDHDRVWRELYEEATHIGVEWNEEELIRIYLRSVDSTHIMHDLSAILKPGATDFPASVVEASYWVASMVQRNKAISENQPPGRKRYKDPQLTANFTQNSNEASSTFPKCVFCEKFHDGGAQKCTRLKALMKAKPDVVEQFTRMESKKSKRRRDKDDGNPKSNRKRSKGSTRRGKANAQKWADREKTYNSQSPKTSAASIAEQESSEVKDLMTKVLKMSKLGELNFHFRVTPLNSYQNGDIKDMSSHYMLDSGSNCNVLGNRELAWNITTIAPTDIVGMGSVTVTEAAECIFGPCLIAPIPLNIIAESAVIKQYSLTLDSTRSPHYIVGGDIQWRRGKHGLIWLSHSDAMLLRYRKGLKNAQNVVHSTQSIAQSVIVMAADTAEVRHYSAEERKRAREVKNIHDIMGHPHDAALGILFDSGCIQGCPYTSRDIRIMRKIYGPCVPCVKGKTVAPSPRPVINKWLASDPGERLCMDLYFLTVISRKGKYVVIPILVMVDDYTGYLHVVPLSSKTTETVRAAIFDVIAFYNHYDFAVKEIRCDREHVFTSLRPSLLRHPQTIELDAMGTDAHEKKAERAIRTLREGFRTVKASCWYRIPQFLYPYFVSDLASLKNCIPNRKTVNRTPRDIVEGKKIAQDQHLRVPLGLVGEFRVPTGTHVNDASEEKEQLKNESRTATGIVVKRNLDSHGSLQVYLIDSGRFVNRAKLRLERTHTNELRRQLEKLAPAMEVDEEDLLRVCPRLSTSRKRRRDNPEHVGDYRGDVTPLDQATQNSSVGSSKSLDKRLTTQNENGDEIEEGLNPPKLVPTTPQPDCNQNTDMTEATSPPSHVEEKDTTSNNKRSSNDLDATDVPKPRHNNKKITRKSNDKRYKTKDDALPKAVNTRDPSLKRNIKKPEKYALFASKPNNMNIKEAKAKYPQLYKEVLTKEIQQFHDKGVAEPIDVPVDGLRHTKIIGVKGFFKEIKNTETGEFEKLKFRLVP